MEVFSLLKIVSSLALGGVACFLFYMYTSVWQEAQRVRRKLKAQGVKGPKPSFLYGNLPDMQKFQKQAKSLKASNHSEAIAHDHDYTTELFPYFECWRKEFGSVYTYSTGMKQHLYINQPELVKQMSQCKSLKLGKPSHVTKRLAPLLGNGILRSNGLTWSQQRKIIAPEFFADKVKGMVGQMVESALPLLRKWEECIEVNGGITAEIKVDEDLKCFSGDVISRVCFGSSYIKVKEIFSKLGLLTKAISNQGFLSIVSGISGKLFPTKAQKEIKSLESEMESMIWESVKERQRESDIISSVKSDKDLMQLILESAISDKSLGKHLFKSFVVDNCKNIYFAGHETTAVAASWSLMLLASHPEWQDRIRAEFAQYCPTGLPDADSLPHLKVVAMVIQEVIRLYPPAAFISREALQDIQIGNLQVPKGVCLWTLIPTLHRDIDIWGTDANEFKPERFKDGVAKACKYSQAYIPFGLGPRLCLGRNFAMVELKILLSLVISKFAFSLSPNYRHSPAYRMIVEPGHGVQIIIHKV